MLGMGGSSRPDFKLKAAEDIEEYMVNWLELWRKQMNLTNFVLAGHSYGGYVCALYACKYT